MKGYHALLSFVFLLSAGASSPLYAQSGGYGPGMMDGGMMGGGMMGGGMMGGGMMGGPYGNGGYDRQAPPQDSAGAQVAQRYCTQCHGLPDPRQHAASDWPKVVARMEGYMTARGFSRPDEKATRALDAYLQKYSAGGRR